MPISAMERTAMSRSGENSSVMAAMRKCGVIFSIPGARSSIIVVESSARISLMAQLASSAENVPHSRIRELAEIAMTMDGVLRLYFGESNLPTPDYIKQAAARAMQDGFTFYTENAGLPSLRRAIAENYRRLHSVDLDPGSEIVVTASGVQALNVGIRCVLDPGDEALVLTPAWPNGASNIAMANAVARQIPHPLCGERYRVDFDALEAAVTPRTRLLLYTSPSNPLGWVATEDEQQGLLDFARRHGLWLMADEVYDRLYYAGARLGDPVPSILRKATRDDAVMVVHSFSKSYCMTGWRVGWLIARQDLAAKATQLNEFIISHAATFAQKAGETALAEGEEELVRMLGRLKENRDLCLDALAGLPGVTVPKPDGAFYLFPRIAGVTDSFAFCKRLLEETRVGLAPGVAFGEGGEGSIRICYAAERSILEPAMERLTKFLRSGA
ncbi:MAG TPA: pyridoxal phosphate-dependent aminotransferase [Bryobacteraceae bacterium]